MRTKNGFYQITYESEKALGTARIAACEEKQK